MSAPLAVVRSVLCLALMGCAAGCGQAGSSGDAADKESAAVPVAPPDMARVEAPVAAEPQHAYGGILIVEDDPAVRTVVAREMEKTGRRIFSCPDGAAARSLLLATPERSSC